MLDEAAQGVDRMAEKAEKFISFLLTVAFIILTCGIGYYGYQWWKKRQKKDRIGTSQAETVNQATNEVEFSRLGGVL